MAILARVFEGRPLVAQPARLVQAALLGALALGGGSVQATRVWFEQGVAMVTTGYDTKAKVFVYRKFYLAATGPDSLGGAANSAIQECTARVTGTLGEELRVALWTVGQPASTTKPSASAVKPMSDSNVDGMLGEATRRFRSAMSRCSAGRFDETPFHLALVERLCDKGPSVCASTGYGFAGQPAAVAYSALRQRVDVSDAQHPTVPLNSPILLLDAIADKAHLQVLAGAAPVAEFDACIKKASEAAAALASAAIARVAGVAKGAASAPDVGVVNSAPTAKDATGPTSAKRSTVCIAMRAATLPLLESNNWSPPPSGQVAQAQLEALVAKARTLHQRIDSGVPRLAGIPVEVALRVIDVLDAPAHAVKGLRSEANAKLLTIQDELARSRVIECTRFKGLTEPAKVSECSGYSLDLSSLSQCLAGATCNPAFAAKGRADVLSQIEAGGLKALSQASELPRLRTSYKQLVDSTNACANSQSHEAAASCVLERELGASEKTAWKCAKGKARGQMDAKTFACALGKPLPTIVSSVVDCTTRFRDSQAQVRCATDAVLPPDAAKMLECQRLSKGNTGDLAICMATKVAGGDVGQAATCLHASGGDAARATACYAAGKLPPEATKMVECQRQSKGNSSDFALCMTTKLAGGEAAIAAECLRKFRDDATRVAECYATAKLPPEARAMAECQRQSKGRSDAFTDCMVSRLAGGEVGKATTCLRASGGDWAKGAACYAAGQLPQPFVQAIACVQQAGGAAPALAGCMAAQNLPENLRKPVQCIAESQGDPFGAGVCMASDGLTSDQRIGLECLVSAGGNPIPFATCAGGRLAVKELFNCVDKKFFEGNCMGSGNEFVKVATALRIDLRPETVVGQVLNYQLDVVKFQVRLAEAASKGVLEVGDKFVHVTNDAAVAVATAVADTKNAVFQGVDDGKTAVVKGLDDGKNAVVKGLDDGKNAVVKGLDDGKNAVKRWLGL